MQIKIFFYQYLSHLVAGDHEAGVVILVGNLKVSLVLTKVTNYVQSALGRDNLLIFPQKKVCVNCKTSKQAALRGVELVLVTWLTSAPWQTRVAWGDNRGRSKKFDATTLTGFF